MVYVLTRAGTNKDISEDSVLVGKQIVSNDAAAIELPNEGFVCVADGVGGRNAGEEASSFVLHALSETSVENADLKEVIEGINQRLIARGNENDLFEGMATTLSGIFIKGTETYLIHIGNTRVYTMQGRYLKQLTSDHTVVNMLNSMGRKEEAELANQNEITNCLGGGDAKLISKLSVTPLSDFSILLMTSDGIHEHVAIDELEDILNTESSGVAKCEAIFDCALSAGSTDDMSVVLVCAQED